MFPNAFPRSLFSALTSCLPGQLGALLTQQPGTAVLGCQIQLGVLARLETRHATPDQKLGHRETAAVGFQEIMPWLVMRRKKIPIGAARRLWRLLLTVASPSLNRVGPVGNTKTVPSSREPLAYREPPGEWIPFPVDDGLIVCALRSVGKDFPESAGGAADHQMG